MKKFMKIMSIVFVVAIALTFICSSVYAAGGNIDPTMPTPTDGITAVNTSATKIWGTVLTIVQILAFAAVVFAGLRYMFASADQKADIKKSMGILALGAILVFAASTIVQWLVDVTEEVV